ncbi:hemerythrin domain-containing protein [Clostridium sp. D2Q-11]|uniref:Hemerythrin domain-containing protein n=1 Tax=Anaeromonas frigoriresistens TaxID=2683708 RepID=A0A942UTT4_9FIRM|nr:hemerythrin domain-containing protein [Anaeromonas frigoriresistens]MBS4539114.1 hemerythrin domain-containing protein [Anaeromonas frigoriresistens]
MNSIDVLVNEHNNIKRVLKIVRCICVDMVEGKEVDIEDFYSIIDFIRNYADKYHHGKEEDMLFEYMSEELSSDIGEGPIRGMFIEHDYGRNYVMNLEIAVKAYEKGSNEAKVDIIANAIGYANLLNNHIHKEDNVIYKYASRHLSKETIERLNSEFEVFENEDKNLDKKKKYLDLIEKLDQKYGC